VQDYADTLDPEAAFHTARARLEELIAAAREHGLQGTWSADAAEQAVTGDGRAVELAVLQGFFDTRAAAEAAARAAGQLPCPRDAAGIEHRRVESGHVRHQATTVGCVTVRRLAFRARGAENLYPGDAELNLPRGLHSHEIAKMAAIESARGSFADATAAITRRCGPVAAPAQVRALAISAAADFDAFYTARVHTPGPDVDLLVLSADAKGIVMRPEDLREGTRKAAQAAAARGGALGDQHAGRKRMATLGTVYDAKPSPRRPHDVITITTADKHKPGLRKKTRTDLEAAGKRPGPKAFNKWLTGSVADDADQVIARMFAQAIDRDPDHRRIWIVLVDGAVPQLEAIKTQAAACGVDIHIVIDFIHVLQYLHAAARAAHPGTPAAAEQALAAWALACLNGRSTHVAAELADLQDSPDTRPEEDRKPIRDAVTYLTNKAEHLRYDTALAKGWPIATGVIEGACRHLIGDRLDITGARWSLAGAEAVLKLRALVANDDFDAYWAFHLKQEHRRNHQTRYQQDYLLTA